jgi:hypothetical protein
MSTGSTNITQDPNVNMAANLSPPHPAQKQKDHATSTIMSTTDRPASCALHSTIPLNATSKIKY